MLDEEQLFVSHSQMEQLRHEWQRISIVNLCVVCYIKGALYMRQ